MMALTVGFDSVLALLLAWLAWQSLYGPNLFRAVVCFMVFGLVLALAWVRLEALDIALAEAAISAGVTGALLLSALGRLRGRYAESERADDGVPRPWTGRHVLLLMPSLIVVVVLLVWVAWSLPAPGLGAEVHARLAESGVENPVTAVLLNFRAFDTLLEVGVLLLAVLACWSFGPALASPAPRVPSPTLPALGRLLFPVFILVAAYLLWQGTHAPGGAFPAGAVLGAGGVLLMLAGALPWSGAHGEAWLRLTLVLGLAVFLAVAVGVMFPDREFLHYPPDWSRGLIMVIEAAATLSIGAILMALYIGGQLRVHRPHHRGKGL